MQPIRNQVVHDGRYITNIILDMVRIDEHLLTGLAQPLQQCKQVILVLGGVRVANASDLFQDDVALLDDFQTMRIE